MDRLPHLRHFVSDGESAGGTHGCALTAGNALGLGKLLAEAAGDKGLDASVCKINGADVLNLLAHSDAFAAENALGRVTDYGRRGVVNRLLAVVDGEAGTAHAVAVAVFLKLASAGLVAGGAVGIMICKQQLKHHLTVLSEP